MLSSDAGSIKEAVSLWLVLCILMQVLRFVVPTGSKSREAAEKALWPALPHCCRFNSECTFANQFLWLRWKSKEKEGEVTKL